MKKTYLFLLLLASAAFTATAQNVGINNDGSPAHVSALLDVKSDNKGLLLPRVALSGTTDNTTIASPAVSLLVYNTATAGSGSSAVVPGFYFWSGTAWSRFDGASNDWSMSGNSGTTAGTHFIGNTDNVPFQIRVNNQLSGHISGEGSTGNFSTSFGYQAGKSLTTGYSNVAVGHKALLNNTTGFDNVAIGEGALGLNVGGRSNIGVGKFTLANTTGSFNAAMGVEALKANTTGFYNIAIGQGALRANTTGNGNLAIGLTTAINNITGSENTVVGYGGELGATNLTNATAIGAYAQSDCSNCLVLGSVSGVNGAPADVNVGIGTTAPKMPLSFRSSLGGKLSLFQSSATNYYGIGIQNSLLQLHSDFAVSDIAFGYGSSTAFTETMRIKGNGNVGIGTKTPNNSLEIHTNSTIAKSQLYLYETEDDYARLRMSNLGNNGNFWDVAGKTGAAPSTSFLNFYYQGIGSNVLSLRGDGSAVLTGVLTQNSDMRLKRDIHPLNHSLQKLQQINGYNYYWKDQQKSQQLQTGLLAQEVQKVFPEMVSKDEQGILSVNYSGLIPVLVEAVKEQQQQISELKMQVNELRELKNELEKLKKAVAGLKRS